MFTIALRWLDEEENPDETYKGRKYHLVCAASTKVQEDNLFIFRALPAAWVQAFFDTMQIDSQNAVGSILFHDCNVCGLYHYRNHL